MSLIILQVPAGLGSEITFEEWLNALREALPDEVNAAWQTRGDGLYHADTNYDQNDAVSNGGALYLSLADGNLGNALTDATKWRKVGGGDSLPAGGTEGQILAKASDDDGDTEWINAPTATGRTGLVATSTTNVTPSNGSKTFTVQTGLDWLKELPPVLISANDGSQVMHGVIQSCNDATGEVLVEVDYYTWTGSGPVAHAGWVFRPRWGSATQIFHNAISPNQPTAGQALVFDGSNWIPTTLSSSGAAPVIVTVTENVQVSSTTTIHQVNASNGSPTQTTLPDAPTGLVTVKNIGAQYSTIVAPSGKTLEPPSIYVQGYDLYQYEAVTFYLDGTVYRVLSRNRIESEHG